MVHLALLLALAGVATVRPPVSAGGGRPFGVPFGAEPVVPCAPATLKPGGTVPKAIRRTAAKNPRKVRIVRPGDALTMDFLPDRVTITVDAAQRILSIRCG